MPTKHTLKQELQHHTHQRGQPPTQAYINNHTPRSHTTYSKAFGGWNEALKAAGVGTNQQKNKQRLTLDCDGPECGETVEKLPKDAERSTHHYCSQACHYEHKSQLYEGDGNPVSTLKTVECTACGEDIQKAKWDRERYNKHYCSDCWGNVTVEVECEWCGETKDVWPSWEEDARFCDNDCRAEWMKHEMVGENHPRWRGGYADPNYGPNWRRQRRRALKRDQHRCQDCGITEATHIERFAENLSVHHKTRLLDFQADGEIDYKAANKLENLVSLCRRCHMDRETSDTDVQ